LGDREPAVLGEQNGGRVTEQVRKLGDRSFLVRHVAPQISLVRCSALVHCTRPRGEPLPTHEKSPGASARSWKHRMTGNQTSHTCAGPCSRASLRSSHVCTHADNQRSLASTRVCDGGR